MVTERLRRVLGELEARSPDEQDRLAVAIQALLDQPPVVSDAVRPDVMAAFEQVVERSTAVLEYLRDK